jgi:hypothetical protein
MKQAKVTIPRRSLTGILKLVVVKKAYFRLQQGNPMTESKNGESYFKIIFEFLSSGFRKTLLAASAFLIYGLVAILLLVVAILAIEEILPLSIVSSISYNTSGFQVITTQGKKTTSVTVPAVQLPVKTDIQLSETKHYEISATGLVSTGHDDYNFAVKFLDKYNTSNPSSKINITSDMLKAKFSNENVTSWRNADGKKIYSSESKGTPTCQQSRSAYLKLMPNEEYGALIGLVTNPDLGNLPSFKPNDFAIFCIGSNALLEPNKEGGLTVSSKNCTKRESKIDKKYFWAGKGELYFAVNDTVLIASADLKNWEVSPDRKTAPCDSPEAEAWRRFYAELYSDTSQTNLTTIGKNALWYLDNEGSLNVSVSEK